MSDKTIDLTSLIGYRVVTPDGPFGAVDPATQSVAPTAMVLRTGRWMFAKHYLVGTDVIRTTNPENKTVSVNATHDELRVRSYKPDTHSPESLAGPFTEQVSGHRSAVTGVSLPRV